MIQHMERGINYGNGSGTMMGGVPGSTFHGYGTWQPGTGKEVDPALALQAQQFNWLKGLWGGGNSQGVGSKLERPQDISTAPIYSGQQSQEALNRSVGGINNQAKTDLREQTRGMGARGVGTNSPIALAMKGANAAGARSQTADARFEIPFQLAEANRDMLLRSQTAQGNQVLGWDQVMNQDAANRRNYQGSLANAIAGLRFG